MTAVFRPGSEAELAEMLRNAREPLRIRGGGTRGGGSGGHAVLETGALSGITLYEPGALTLVARAGTPLAQIEAELQEQGQHLPFEPMDHRALLGTAGHSTIGGVVAGNVSGPRRIARGACRDYLLGVRFVDGTGRVVKNGGRVMKNVTGYDLVKLMAGAKGTLGVLTEVSLKVLPRPVATATLCLAGLDFSDAVRAMSAALGSPFEVSGAAYRPATANGPSRVFLRLEGFAEQLAHRAPALAGQLDAFGAAEIHHDGDIWRGIGDVEDFAGQPGDVWRISCRPSLAPALVSRLGALPMLADWGGGLLWLLVPEGQELRASLGKFDGHAVRVRGAQDCQPEQPAMAALASGLRKRFDPRGILNPGLMGPIQQQPATTGAQK